MRIRVNSDEHRLNLRLPSWLVFNPVVAAICAPFIGGNLGTEFEHISRHDVIKFFREIRKARRYMNGEPVVYVSTSDGTMVEIYL